MAFVAFSRDAFISVVANLSALHVLTFRWLWRMSMATPNTSFTLRIILILFFPFYPNVSNNSSRGRASPSSVLCFPSFSHPWVVFCMVTTLGLLLWLSCQSNHPR